MWCSEKNLQSELECYGYQNYYDNITKECASQDSFLFSLPSEIIDEVDPLYKETDKFWCSCRSRNIFILHSITNTGIIIGTSCDNTAGNTFQALENRLLFSPWVIAPYRGILAWNLALQWRYYVYILCPLFIIQLYFQPSFFHYEDVDSIQQTIVKAIQEFPIPPQDLNILIVGGVSMVRGFPERLKKELQALLPGKEPTIIAPPDVRCWFVGSSMF